MEGLHDLLPLLLRPRGRYSFFNGLAPDNFFFHLVCGEVARRQLGALGLDVEYEAIHVGALAEGEWSGVAARYWHLPTYFLPKCELKDVEDGKHEGANVPCHFSLTH
jgi:type IV protein arginine methyltransferase